MTSSLTNSANLNNGSDWRQACHGTSDAVFFRAFTSNVNSHFDEGGSVDTGVSKNDSVDSSKRLRESFAASKGAWGEVALIGKALLC